MDTTMGPQPRLIALELNGCGYLPLLQGPPASSGMRSGYVSLEPNASVGRHSTGRHEEMLVVLGGAGRMFLSGHDPLDLRAPCAAYCPPDTEHDVVNNGSETLRYVYVVAPVARRRRSVPARRSP